MLTMLSERLIKVTALKKLVEQASFRLMSGLQLPVKHVPSICTVPCMIISRYIPKILHTENIHSTYTWRTPIQDRSTHIFHINLHTVYSTSTQQLTWVFYLEVLCQRGHACFQARDLYLRPDGSSVKNEEV